MRPQVLQTVYLRGHSLFVKVVVSSESTADRGRLARLQIQNLTVGGRPRRKGMVQSLSGVDFVVLLVPMIRYSQRGPDSSAAAVRCLNFEATFGFFDLR